MPATATMPISEINFEASAEIANDVLWESSNPGRWLAIALGDDEHEGQLHFGYSLGGRSEPSRNRMAIIEGRAVRLITPGLTTEEMADLPGSALTHYHAMDGEEGVFVVSNGAQTRPVLRAILLGQTLEEAILSAPTEPGLVGDEMMDVDLSSFEPDAPIFTPRITGFVDLRPGAVESLGFAVVRKNLDTGEAIRNFYTGSIRDLQPGQGLAIQTYGNNDADDKKTPVPHFDQPPYEFAMEGGTSDIAETIQYAVGERTFASGVVRAIDIARKEFAGNTIINTRG